MLVCTHACVCVPFILADLGCVRVCVPALQLRPPTVIGQFHTLFFGSVRMFFLGVLGFAVYGNEALHFSCDPDRRELNLYCYNQFRPITPQVQPQQHACQRYRLTPASDCTLTPFDHQRALKEPVVSLRWNLLSVDCL